MNITQRGCSNKISMHSKFSHKDFKKKNKKINVIPLHKSCSNLLFFSNLRRSWPVQLYLNVVLQQ